MKNKWQTKKLADVCIIKPAKKEAKEKLKDSDFVSFLPMKDLGISQQKVVATRERKFGEVVGSYTYFADGDVLLAKITPCFENGKLGIVRNLKNGVGFGSSEYVVFRTKEDLLPEYLFRTLSSDDFITGGKKHMSGAVGHKRVSKEFIENYEISLPSLPEQQRIVKILDETFEKLEIAKINTEKNLQNAKNLLESYLQNVFTNPKKDWVEKKLETVTLKIGSGATPRGGRASYKKIGISLVRSMNVHDRRFKEKNLAFIDDMQANNLSNVILKKGDVLINITGASIARCCICPDKYLPARVNQHVSIIRPKQEIIDSVFLNYLLTTKIYKDQLLGIGEQGSTRQAITKAQLEDFTILVPKLQEQKSIVVKLDTLSTKTKKLEKIYQQKIYNLEELKKSILQKAFNGEL